MLLSIPFLFSLFFPSNLFPFSFLSLHPSFLRGIASFFCFHSSFFQTHLFFFHLVLFLSFRIFFFDSLFFSLLFFFYHLIFFSLLSLLPLFLCGLLSFFFLSFFLSFFLFFYKRISLMNSSLLL